MFIFCGKHSLDGYSLKCKVAMIFQY